MAQAYVMQKVYKTGVLSKFIESCALYSRHNFGAWDKDTRNIGKIPKLY